jgi:hypothetical protein
MFILLTLMSESTPQVLKPFVCRTSAPNTPAGRAPSNRRVETKGDDRHLTFMLDVYVRDFMVEAVFAVDEISMEISSLVTTFACQSCRAGKNGSGLVKKMKID